MSTSKHATTARASARSAESQPETGTPASLGMDDDAAASQREQPPVPRTVSALTRNIEGCLRQIEWTDQKITAATRRQEASEILALTRQKANLVARKGILERLRDGQVRSCQT
jgi:hypothetical protein